MITRIDSLPPKSLHICFLSAPGLHTCLGEPRHQFRPPRSVFFPPAKTEATCRPCLAELRHRLSISFGRNMPSASSSLASSGISHTRTHFVHNLYTKNRTAENRAPNLHPRWQHAGTQNKKREIMENNISTQALSYSRNSLKAPLLTQSLPDSDLSVPREPLLNSESLSAPR